MFAGQIATGGWASRTVTLKLQTLLRPAASVARHMTTVEPTGNAEPLGGRHATVAPGQLSLAVAV